MRSPPRLRRNGPGQEEPRTGWAAAAQGRAGDPDLGARGRPALGAADKLSRSGKGTGLPGGHRG